MKKICLKVSDVRKYFAGVKKNPAKIFRDVKRQVKNSLEAYLNGLMNAEITLFLGREPYERAPKSEVEVEENNSMFPGREPNEGSPKKEVDAKEYNSTKQINYSRELQLKNNYRNGSYDRSFTLKGIGKLRLRIPRDRNGEFKTGVIPRYQRHEGEITRDVVMMYLGGLSTRNIEFISEKLLGCKISKSSVSRYNEKLRDAVEAWRNRDLSLQRILYMYIDGVNFDVRLGDSIEKLPVLVAIGVDDAGYKHVLGFQGGDKESASCWREFFKDLKNRGLRSQDVQLGIMDGLPGLERVFREEFSSAKIQRCQVHLARNVLAKTPVKFRKEVADSLRDIFYSSSRDRAMNYFEDFREKWQKLIPSALRCLERSVDKALTYLKFDESLWISLRTTNPIERVNKEYKRRTKPMEIVGGESSLYNILTFISLKMESGWRKAPISSNCKKMTWLQEKFTKNS